MDRLFDIMQSIPRIPLPYNEPFGRVELMTPADVARFWTRVLLDGAIDPGFEK